MKTLNYPIMFTFEQYMIQRSQSLFLLAIIIICGIAISLTIPYFTTKNRTTNDHVTVAYNTTTIITNEGSMTEKNKLIIYCVFAIFTSSLLSLISFKNRKLQLLLISLNFITICLLGGLMYAFSLGMNYFNQNDINSFKIGSTLPIVILFLNLAAFRGVKKDEQLVRSMDRLR